MIQLGTNNKDNFNFISILQGHLAASRDINPTLITFFSFALMFIFFWVEGETRRIVTTCGFKNYEHPVSRSGN